MKAYECCKWAVAYKVDGVHYDDGKERTCVTALFKDPWAAEDFIEKCLPADTKDRFFVINVDKLD